MTKNHPATTRGEAMLALRKARMAAAPPFLRGGFRPFFFGGAAWAVVALSLWLMALAGGLQLPSRFETLAWHRHEMLFGFVGAIIAGFLLTAIPNWTGRLPIAGPPLAALAGLWLAARLAVLWSATTGLVAAMVLDVGFYLVLAFVAAREVVAAKNRNVPIVGLVLLFAVANAVDYLAVFGLTPDSEAGFRAGIALVVMIISLVGGRIVPSFTRNWMSKQGCTGPLPTQPGRFDVVVLAASALALAAWTLFPSTRLTGIALVVIGALQAVRLARWSGWRTVRDPLVLVLHIGYAWIPVGLVLLGWSILSTALPRSAAVHALTVGAMATMILGVMTRASLGHTGRPLVANAATVAVFALVTVGAVLRLAASLGLTDYRTGLELAGVSWGGAFVLFLAAYAPALFRSRAPLG
jgi:uncharacterized protein involved in response to NO